MGNKVGRGAEVNRAQLANHFGVAKTTVDDWVQRGCPVEQRGSRGVPWKFNTAEIFKWLDQQARAETAGVQIATTDELRRRKLAAETGSAELAYSKEAELVAPIEQIERAMIKAFGEVRGSLRRVLPARAARRLVGETNETRFKTVLLEEIDHCLEALADEDLINEADLDLEDEDDEGDD